MVLNYMKIFLMVKEEHLDAAEKYGVVRFSYHK